MDSEESKRLVGELVAKYEQVTREGRAGKYNEEMTKKDFILPLFRALGWNTEDSNEVTAEEKISKKRVDYGFRINGIPKFFLEAKSLKEDLDNPKFIEQAINYAWHKGCTWAVLTDFESVKIFNAEWKTSNPSQSHLKTIPCQEFLIRFDELWLLSKESFEQGLIDKEAEKWGKKTKKISVDKQLLADFTRFRELLSKNITKLNQNRNITEEDLDESVQRILDRLIFIRNCEDRELEAKTLISSFREWESRGRGQLIKSLREVFAYFDKQYNSKIFANHLCDSLDIDNEVLHEIIEGLYYTKDKSVSYDFSAIEADVLGNIYEQYLGHILKKSEKRAKLTENHAHRKEQGIYYTPTYIVDYIVRNTLGEILKDKKVNVEKIRVLDPACGSGSFLIKAFDVLNEHYAKHDKNYSQTQIDFKTNMPFTTKTKILKNNIFGVDLDKQAVEIAQLNLLLKIAEKGHRLPLLQENIKCGNSLIDDPAIAGDKAFKWEEEFKEVMQEGGFDVVIGNPPYVDIKQLDPKIVRYFFDKYPTVENRMNLYAVFVERSLSLLKDGGYFGFIIPNSILYNESYQKIRTLLLDKVTLRKIVRLPDNVFQNVKVETIILIYQKKKETTKKLNCEVLIYPREVTINAINKESDVQVINFNQKVWEAENNIINISTNTSLIQLLNKIEKETEQLINICDFSLGLTPYDKYKGHTKSQIEGRVFHAKTKKNTTFKPLLSGENIERYGIFWDGKEYISYGNWLGAPREQRFFTKPRIVIRQIISGKPPRIYAGYTEEEFYNTQIAFNIIAKDETKISSKYLLAILNSKLMNFYHKEKYLDPSKNLFQKILIVNAKKFPIKILSLKKQQPLIILVDKMLSLNKRLNEIGDKKTDERAKIEEEIKKADAEIDELVYEIYGLTRDEINIIEDNIRT